MVPTGMGPVLSQKFQVVTGSGLQVYNAARLETFETLHFFLPNSPNSYLFCFQNRPDDHFVLGFDL